MNIRIFNDNSTINEDSLVNPDVIQNRFGAIYTNYVMLLIERENDDSLYIPFHKDGNKGNIGICLTPISQNELNEIIKFIFIKYKQIKQIKCEYSLNQANGYVKNYPANQWHLLLPATTEELWTRMSSKSKQTLRRKQNHLIEQLGSEPVFEHYTINEGIPDEIVNIYFTFKKELMNRDYNMLPQEYLHNYFVTDAYVWKINSSDNNSNSKYLSMLFTCEQGENVYLENLSYNPLFQKESPGFLLYCKVIEELINKRKKEFFLGRKYRDYKQKFESQNTECFDIIAFRSLFFYITFLIKKVINKISGNKICSE